MLWMLGAYAIGLGVGFFAGYWQGVGGAMGRELAKRVMRELDRG